ncbi:methyltransferase [Aureococcus anophagefferens]|nr:methyltransferase [Aureococcus anophagefferens]
MEVTPVEAFDDTDGAARAQLNDSDGAARARLKAELKAEILAELDAQELRGPSLLDVARSIKPTIMGEMGGSSVMRKRLSTMARVETGEDKVPSFQPLHERTDASYYFRVETMVLYDPTTWRVAMHWVLVCLSVLLQLLALQTVWQALWYPFDFMKWGLSVDEARRYFHSGIAFPASYRKLFHYADDSSLMGVPIIVFGPLFFCVFVLVMSTTDEEASCKAGYLLLRREVAAADARTAKVRLVACYLLHVVRLSLVCLATAFVLEIDEVIFVVMPSHNFYGVEHADHRSRYARRLRLARNRFRDAVAAVERAPRSLRRLYDATSWLFPLGVGGCVFQITLLMQHYTSRSYNWLVYGLLAVILVDLEVAVFVVAADGGESSRVRDAAVAARGGGARGPRAAAASLAWLLFTGAVLVVARIVVVRWVLGNLLPFGMSAASLPLDFWDSVDPTPNRPEDRYDYDYDYGEAAYGNGADYAYGGDYAG